MKKYDYFQKVLEKKKKPFPLHPITSTKENTLNFASNDSLALSQHPYIKKIAIKYLLEWGIGPSNLKLISGNLESQQEIEEKLAHLIGKDSTLLFESSYQAKKTLLKTIGNQNTIFLIDQFCENNLIKAATESQATLLFYEHQNLNQLKALLKKYQQNASLTKIIISESLSNLSGQTCNLKSLIKLSSEYHALLYINEAHSIGVLGKHGMGLTAHQKGVDLITGTFGLFGAYIGLNHIMQNYLLENNPEIGQKTQLPPPIIGAISSALDLIPDMQIERKEILKKSRDLKEELISDGWKVENNNSHIISIPFKSENETKKAFQILSQSHILTTILLPPETPKGLQHLRLTINTLHTEEQIQTLLQTLKILRDLL